MTSSLEFFEAIAGGDSVRVRALLEEDPALAAARDSSGVSALMRARYGPAEEVRALIRQQVAELDPFEASAYGDAGSLASSLASDPSLVFARSADGFSALHLAAFFGQVEAARQLLAAGAEVDAAGTGWMTGTPLHSAASAMHAEIVAMLLRSGADPNARQLGGWTPLHSAAANGDERSVDLLLAAGADPAATQDEGHSVLSLAAGSEAVSEKVRRALDQAER